MGIHTFAHGCGQFVGSIRGREARRPRRWRLRAMPGALVCLAIFANPAAADGLRNGIRAFAAHDYITAARIFTDLAPLGDARAQTYLGYMFANGKGVPQNYMVAAGWYRCASQQGFPAAQYMLGLMYDKGQGVPQDYVIAYALLDLAVAGAGPRARALGQNTRRRRFEVEPHRTGPGTTAGIRGTPRRRLLTNRHGLLAGLALCGKLRYTRRRAILYCTGQRACFVE